MNRSAVRWVGLVVGVATGLSAAVGCSSGGSSGAQNGGAAGSRTSTGGTPGSGGASASGGGTSSAGSNAGGAATGGGSSGGATGGAGPVTTLPGNPDGNCAIPAAARAVDVSSPTTVVGDGTAASCTGSKVVAAVHAGGIVTFDCGPDPIAIAVPEISIFNDGGQGDGSVTIDGGGKVTLVPDGAHRILYQNTCDANLHYTSTRCDLQTTPHMIVQNIAFSGGSVVATDAVKGGGAIFVSGGTFKAVNVTFADNAETNLGQDYAGGGLYTFEQNEPVYVVSSTFRGNSGSNGGGLGSLFGSYTILNSSFENDSATGNGMNPAQPNTPGGGLGGAIYNDGNDYTLTICGTLFRNNQANELGTGSIFQVVNDLNGDLNIDQSTFTANGNNGSVQPAHPSIYVEARDKVGTAGVTITNTTFN